MGTVLSISPEDRTVIVSGIVGVITAIIAFLITRFGYARKYRIENEKLQHESDIERIQTDKIAFETYNEIIQSFKKQVEDINEQKEALIQRIKRMREVINETKIEKKLN